MFRRGWAAPALAPEPLSAFPNDAGGRRGIQLQLDRDVKLPVVAVVGRPNVGKSTFFNRVLGERLAIVEDRPGVTRDRNFARADWAGRQFYLVDTGGMVEGSDEPMDRLIRRQVIAAIDEADVVVCMVDGKDGPHPLDYSVAEFLRRSRKPTVLLVNKMDNVGRPARAGAPRVLGAGPRRAAPAQQPERQGERRRARR